MIRWYNITTTFMLQIMTRMFLYMDLQYTYEPTDASCCMPFHSQLNVKIEIYMYNSPGPDFTKLVFTYDASRGLRCIAALRVVADAMCSTIHFTKHFTKHIVRATRSNPV